MYKNVLNLKVLLAIGIFLIFSSCSSEKKVSYHEQRRGKTTRSVVKSTPKKSRKKARTKIATPAIVDASNVRYAIVSTAKQYLGKPYKYGGKQPSSGFDCSGFTAHVFKENGVDISGPSYLQAKKGTKKGMKDLNVGDLVFFGSSKKVSHVAIVASVDSRSIDVIHSTSSRGVVIDNISDSDYWKKRYLFGRDVLE